MKTADVRLQHSAIFIKNSHFPLGFESFFVAMLSVSGRHKLGRYAKRESLSEMKGPLQRVLIFCK